MSAVVSAVVTTAPARAGLAPQGAAPAGVPVVASRALADLLTGAPRTGAVLAAWPAAAYVDVEGELVAILAAGASRIPCGVRLAPGAAPPSSWCAAGERVTVGARAIDLPRRRLRVARWWDPVPALPPLGAAALAAWRDRVAGPAEPGAPGLQSDPAGERALAGLGAALRERDAGAALAAADALLGRGSGSTPAGDDVLAGAVVGARLLASAAPEIAAPLWERAGQALADHLSAAAPSRTTPLSAALLRHAAAGRPLGELADVIRAAAGAPPLEPAVRRLRAVGHTSGRDLLAGLLVVVDAVLAPPRKEP